VLFRSRALKEDFERLEREGNRQSAEEGADAGMRVIALELCQYGNQLEAAAGDCMTIADALAKSAAAAVRDWVCEPERGSEGAAAATALGIAAERIREARDKTETDIVSIVAKGDMVLNMLEISSTRLDFHTGVGEILDLVTAELTRLGASASPYRNENTQLLETMLNRMARFYSMAQEREIHRLFVAALGAGTSEPSPAQFESDDFETILF
jgi:hypothetical protein